MCVDLILDHLQLAIRLFLAKTQPWLTSPPTAPRFGDRKTAEEPRGDAKPRRAAPPAAGPHGACAGNAQRAAAGAFVTSSARAAHAAAAATLCAVAARAAPRRSLDSGGRLKGGGLPPGMLQPARGSPPCSRPRSSSLSGWRPTRRAFATGP